MASLSHTSRCSDPVCACVCVCACVIVMPFVMASLSCTYILLAVQITCSCGGSSWVDKCVCCNVWVAVRNTLSWVFILDF
jgi:hypothetical protein